MEDLNNLRQQGIRMLAIIAWLATAIIAGGSLVAGTGFLPVLLAVAVSVYPTIAAVRRSNDAAMRIALGATMPVYCAIMLYQWSGGAWLIDLHMTFFAMIAVVAVLADWRPVLAGAAVTAAHHLILNYAAPEYVFGNGAQLGRVMLHAVIVVLETVVLMFLTVKLEALLLAQVEARRKEALAEQEAVLERRQREEEQHLVVEEIARGLKALASGDMTCQIRTKFPYAFDELREDFNSAVHELDKLVGSVAQSSGQIQNGANEIRAAADDLARRTETQAASVERATHTITELVASASSTARLADDACNTLAHSQVRAAEGHDVMARAMATMERIERSASEINQIVSLIDGIAFQTNLLALNAGVEAARAGDAGKGFAVVANEVRALAQRSADAAKDINALISASSSQVGEGVELVTQTGTVLQELMDEVASIGSTVTQIAEAVKGTSVELSEVRDTFGAIDRSTQQNAAMVEESNAAVRTLASETDRLMESVKLFHGSDDRQPLRRAA